jgi:hypothetical protein
MAHRRLVQALFLRFHRRLEVLGVEPELTWAAALVLLKSWASTLR